MKKLIYISFVFAFLLAFASCQKEVIEPKYDCGECGTRGASDSDQIIVGEGSGTRGGDDEKDDGIVDPDEDEDFDEDDDGIVDPDEDEDFDEEEDGK